MSQEKQGEAIMAKKQTSITLDASIIDIGLYALAVIDEQLRAARGSASQKRAEAWEALQGDSINKHLPPGCDLEMDVAECLTLLKEGGSWSQLEDAVASLTSIYNEVKAEAINEKVQEAGGTTSELVGALKEQREALVVQIQAFSTMFNVETTIPKAPGGRSTNGGTATTSKFQYYTIINGVRHEPSSSQNSLSSISFYKGEQLCGSKGVELLRAAITKAGCDPSIMGAAWEATLPGGVVGLSIIEQD
jgi:hypothetical protein